MPQPICFMVMPYGTKETGAKRGQGPTKVNFDALWRKAFEPLIKELGYDPVRADQDIGALIIHEMLERLYFADLVLADMTLPNGNIYVEAKGADTWKMDTTINDLQRTVEQTRDEEKRKALQQLVEELRNLL